MNFSYLPIEIQIALGALNLNIITEIRLKSGQPVIIAYGCEYKYLKHGGVSDSAAEAIVCNSAEKILERAMGNSVYAYSEQLKYGFITVDGGIRIGVAAEYVTQNGCIVSIRDVSSLSIRIPHEVIGCAERIYEVVMENGFGSTLIFSPPSYGKTTILRDLIRIISTNKIGRVLVADERNEICGNYYGVSTFTLGDNYDVVSGANKKFVFENSVRALSPKIIATDELYGDDYLAVEFLNECGVSFLATSHVCDKKVLMRTCASYFVELGGIAKRARIYDKNFNTVCDCDTVGIARLGVSGK